jgi:hypothetical protein
MKSSQKILEDALILLSKLPYEEILKNLKNHKNSNDIVGKDRFNIYFKCDAIFINDIEIVNKKSLRKYQIFIILFDKFIDDYKSGISTEEFSSVSVAQISKILDVKAKTKLDPEKQVRWHINQLQQKLRNLFGVEIVETLRWAGYRLNPLAVSFFKGR